MPGRGTIVLLGALLCAGCPGSSQEAGGEAPGASPSPTRFVVLSDDVVRDTRTGLEWTRRDDGKGLDWHKAEAYCRALAADGGGAWRLPEIDELHALYEERVRQSCGEQASCSLDPVFSLSSPYVWSATARDPASRFYLDFQFGTQLSPSLTPVLVRRVLCVRPAAASAGEPPAP